VFLQEIPVMPLKSEYDLVVVGSGAAGLACAITAKSRGLDVAILEKEPVFGGTTALSGGVLWIPLTHHGKKQNPGDSVEDVVKFMRAETGAFYDEEAVRVFIEQGPRMVDFMERETQMKFVPTLYPDYHPDALGGVDVGRSILAAPYDIRGLGKDMDRLKPPLKTITFIGMMFNSSNADLKHFFRATKSMTSALYVARRLANHVKELVLYRRAVQVTSGNALAARLAKSALDLGIPILTETPVTQLLTEGDAVGGVVATHEGQRYEVRARRGVVLACGGFPHDVKRIAQAYPHVRRGHTHLSPTPVSNTGDGVTMAESAGAAVDIRFTQPAAWMPVTWSRPRCAIRGATARSILPCTRHGTGGGTTRRWIAMRRLYSSSTTRGSVASRASCPTRLSPIPTRRRMHRRASASRRVAWCCSIDQRRNSS